MKITLDNEEVPEEQPLEELPLREFKKQGISMNYQGDDMASVRSLDFQVTTPEEAIKRSGIDLKIWRVKSVKTKSWACPMKLKKRVDKKIVQETPHREPIWLIEVQFERKAPKYIQEGIIELASMLRKAPPVSIKPRVKAKQKGGRALEVGMYDAHLGKLAWAKQVGKNYDTKIAIQICENAVTDSLNEIGNIGRVDKVVIPVGNDFFHANNWALTTAKGTPMDHDGRFSKVFRGGCQMFIRIVEAYLEVAPVEIIWVPGNHDPETSYYLCTALEQRFWQHKHVMVDLSEEERKYWFWGDNFVMFDHGNEFNHSYYMGLASTERPNQWARAKFREVHNGHIHKKKEVRMVTADEFFGFRIVTLPSLCAVDAWHFKKGYINSRRCMETRVWDTEEGPVNVINTNARE